MIEIMIGITIFSILILVGLPSFTQWMQSSQIRTMTETMLAGVQLARAEAVRRNSLVRFQMVSTMDATCALSTSGTNWIVSLDDPTGLCDVANSETTTPRILQSRASGEGTLNAAVAGSQTTLVFNGLGRVTPVPSANVTFDITNPTGGTCASASGKMRCLRVVVSPGGQVRMCDPAVASTDPQGC
jgi:type IV fimbrial biogenesis protein FimT